MGSNNDGGPADGTLSFIEKSPDVPSWNLMFMLEALAFKVTISASASVSPKDIQVQAWTNIYHRDNPEGVWHAIDLKLIAQNEIVSPSEGKITLHFGESVMLTSHGQYKFTYRCRRETRQVEPQPNLENWIWANGYMVDGIVNINPPSEQKWTKGPEFNHITNNVYLGNFMAASIADNLGFDAVLNVADNLDLIPEKFSREVIYEKIPMADGAVNPIPDALIYQAVYFIRQMDASGKKILVNCRAGIGRAGSTVVAYVFSENNTMSYKEAFEFVSKKRFIYPHKSLERTLIRLFPRNQEPV